jgi:anti-anti-sigma factor
MKQRFYSTTKYVTGVKELVRGQEQEFLSELRPVVARQNVTLNLEETDRIDAAGVAALVVLYCDACKSGHRFAIANPSPRVQDVLRLVGLDAILVAGSREETVCFGTRLQVTAA